MKGKALLSVCVLLVASSMASAAYVSLSHNVVGADPEDTVFDPVTGLFTINDTTVGVTHTANPAIVPPGVQGNATVSLSTTLVGYDTPAFPGKALFSGGDFSLSLLFDPENDGSYNSYSISGPISGLVIDYQIYDGPGGKMTRFNGEGIWTAVTKNLPAEWLDNGGYSSIATLTIEMGTDFTGYDWTTGFAGQSQYILWPDDRAAPEPGTLLLLAGGALFLRRRRVA